MNRFWNKRSRNKILKNNCEETDDGEVIPEPKEAAIFKDHKWSSDDDKWSSDDKQSAGEKIWSYEKRKDESVRKDK